MKHVIVMLLGCVLPLLLIFLAPALGLRSNTSFFFFMIAMFACHLLMPMHHGGHRHGQHPNPATAKNENHGNH